jgi:arabinofuranosyltransferase
MLLYLVYIVRVGGDFMSGRFLTAPFVCALALLASIDWSRVRVWPAIAAAVLVIGLAGAHPPIISGAGYGRPRPESQIGPITDERNVYYAATGLLLAPYQPEIPNHRRTRAGREAARAGTRVVTQSAIGFFGFAAGTRVHVIDVLALADPLLARLPARRPWHIGHFYRRVPDGYEETIRSGRIEIRDPGVAAFYSRLALIVRGDLWSGDRWRAIVRMNTGGYDSLLADYGLTRLRLSGLSSVTDAIPLYERGARIDLGRVVDRGRFEISLDADDQYRIGLWRVGENVATTTVGPSAQPTGTLVKYEVSIPDRATVDTLSILPIDGDHTYGLGSVRLVD